MRWIKRLSLIFLVTLLLLIAGVSFTLSQKLKQAEITNLSGSFSHLDLTSLELEKLSATYQQQQHIKLEKLKIHWTEVDTWFDPAFQITTLTIENVHLQLSSQTLIEDQTPIVETSADFSWPKTAEAWQTDTFLSERFAWLALLPKTAEIKHLTVSRDCPAGLCTLSGQLSASIENSSQTTPLHLSIKGSLANPDLPESELSIQLKAALTPENLPSLQLQASLDKSLNLTLNNHLTADNQLSSKLSLSGIAPNPIWFKTLEAWSGFSLSEAALLQLQQQALTPVKIEASNNMPLASVDLLIQQLMALPSKTELLQEEEQSPITIPTELLSKISTQLELTIELPKPTPVPAVGLLQGLLKAKLELQQGKLQDYQLQTSGTLSKHSTTEKLQAIKSIKGLEIAEIGFELNSQSDSKETTSATSATLANIPFELTLNSVSPSTNKRKFRLFAQGELDFEEKPTLVLHNGLLSLQQPLLRIQPNADKIQYRFSNLKADIPFTADYRNKSLKVMTAKAVIKGNLQVLEPGKPSNPMAKLNQSSLQLKSLSFNLKHDDSIQLTTPITWSLSSKQATLKTQLSSPQLKAKNLQVSLNGLQISGSNNAKTSTPLQIKANYSVTTPRLEQSQLLPQFWAAKGSASGNLNNLTFSGRVSNAAEFNIQHNSRWKNQVLSSDWTLDPLFFLASNPLKKTFTLWPTELTLASGQLALKGQVKFNTKALKDPLSALSGTINAEMKQVSGLYQQTAFSQISTVTALNLSNKQFKITLPTLKITQVTHGLIAGPIEISAQYQGAIDNPKQGLLNIERLQSGLFNGQAWLKPQTIDLSKGFKTQLYLKDAEIEELLKQHPTSDLTGRGLVDGTLPLEIYLTTEPAIFLIQQGQVSSQASGGLLKYQPAAKSGIGKSNQSMQLVLDVLDDFHYTLLQSSVSIGEDKKLILGLKLNGRNPKVEKGRAVNLNINLEEDLPSLITSMQITNQVSETIKRRVQEKVQQQTAP